MAPGGDLTMRLGKFIRDRRGGIAIMFAIGLPVVATVAVAAIDLASVNADRSNIQDVADAAAITGAKQLGVSDAQGVEARANDYVASQLAHLKDRLTYTVTTTTSEDFTAVTVKIAGSRTSFFGNMLPPGGWPIGASATAVTMGKVPLCVLSAGAGKADQIQMFNTSQITAGGCMVHSNADISVSSTAWLQAAMVQSSGLATGRISPEPQQSAPAIDDPFKDMVIAPPPSLCLPVDVLLSIGLNVLPPGVHCGRYIAGKDTTLKLQPGEHYFKGQLVLQQNAILQGTDVVLVFDDTSMFNFQDSSQVNLTGRTSGAFAGFVMATTRKNTKQFMISSDSARQLLGTVYIPEATLLVTGTKNKIADESAWTVIVAKAITTQGSPNLVINSNYAGSSVPVPTGVGPSASSIRLEH